MWLLATPVIVISQLTYKQSFKRNAYGFHFLCVWVMNTDTFCYEFRYEGLVPERVWQRGPQGQGCTRGVHSTHMV